MTATTVELRCGSAGRRTTVTSTRSYVGRKKRRETGNLGIETSFRDSILPCVWQHSCCSQGDGWLFAFESLGDAVAMMQMRRRSPVSPKQSQPHSVSPCSHYRTARRGGGAGNSSYGFFFLTGVHGRQGIRTCQWCTAAPLRQPSA